MIDLIFQVLAYAQSGPLQAFSCLFALILMLAAFASFVQNKIGPRFYRPATAGTRILAFFIGLPLALFWVFLLLAGKLNIFLALAAAAFILYAFGADSLFNYLQGNTPEKRDSGSPEP
jgi:hypothetical protein